MNIISPSENYIKILGMYFMVKIGIMNMLTVTNELFQ
jgi:hypothetical protein